MQYKLLKKYPGLPNNWEVGMIVGQGDRINGSFSPCNGKYTDVYINSEYVVNNPEFWEKVVKYPLSYNDLKNGEYYTTEYPKQGLYTFKQGYKLWMNHRDKIKMTFNDGDFKPTNDFHNFRLATAEEIQELCQKDYDIVSLENVPNFGITSIRRTSDNEIFKVGDAVQLKMVNKYWKDTNCTISKITIFDTKVRFYIKQGSTVSPYTQGINYWRKVPDVLFKSEDGIDIREGDDLYWVNKTLNFSKYEWSNNNRKFVNSEYFKTDDFKNYKWFSSEESAKEYIIYNNPCLSINDFKKTHFVINELDLKQLVKSKIKL